jgi:hypothetical protein
MSINNKMIHRSMGEYAVGEEYTQEIQAISLGWTPL